MGWCSNQLTCTPTAPTHAHSCSTEYPSTFQFPTASRAHALRGEQVVEGRRRVHELLLQQLQEKKVPTVPPFVILFLNVVPAEDRLAIYRAYSQARIESAHKLVWGVCLGRGSDVEARGDCMYVKCG